MIDGMTEIVVVKTRSGDVVFDIDRAVDEGFFQDTPETAGEVMEKVERSLRSGYALPLYRGGLGKVMGQWDAVEHRYVRPPRVRRKLADLLEEREQKEN